MMRETGAGSEPMDFRNIKIVQRKTADLKPYANNSRDHSPEQVAQIVASIREFGFTNPVLVDGSGMIIAGHGRVMAAVEMGLAKVPTITLDGLTPEQVRAYVIADNRIAENATWNMDKLRAELGELQVFDFDLSKVGFTAADVQRIMDAPKPGKTDPDHVPPAPAIPVSVPGDIWRLGKHRLMCGSCTDRAAVDKLMDGERADLSLTDPPYGLGDAKESGKNDYLEYVDTRENLVDLARQWLPIARDVAKVVVFSPGVTNQWIYPEPSWVMCWFYGGGQLRSPWGFNCWQPFLCYGKEPGLAAGRGARPDAVDMNTPANAADINHPCPKPVKLWAWMLERLIFKENAIIYEPFSGSGTTIIAAQDHGICVRAMELVPTYVDVAIARWQSFAGDDATLEGDGRTFAQIAAERAQA